MMKLLAFSLVLFVAAVAPLAFGQGLPQVAPTCEKQLDFVRLYAQELSNKRNRVEGELVQTRVQSADIQKEI